VYTKLDIYVFINKQKYDTFILYLKVYIKFCHSSILVSFTYIKVNLQLRIKLTT